MAESNDGTISLVVVVALAVATFMAMLIVDIAAWGLANAQAQAAADAGALAAVVQASSGADGRSEAQRVAQANGATLVTCRCDGHDGPATTISVTVAMPVAGFVIPLVGFERVHATASATMVGQPVSLQSQAATSQGLRR
ncbi:MAG: pilus assembly protein TadG-related protein [Nitriliruptoraceae bacterium]